jgi:site-specific recombinase XerD
LDGERDSREDEMSRRALPQPLEPGEVRAVLGVPDARTAIGLRNRTMVALMAESGLRVAEVVALRTADLDSGLERLRVVAGKTGDRVVPLSEANRARLAEWLTRRAALCPDSPWVFPQLRSSAWRRPSARAGAKARGSRLSTAYVRAMTARLGARAGVARRTNPHAFRHTAATAMLEAQYSVAEVQAVLGHASLVSTSVYLHVRDVRLADRLRGYRPAWDDAAAPSPEPVAWLPPRADLLPVGIAAACRALSSDPTRARAFLLLWLAGYEPGHARVLALGPGGAVADLLRAAGEPDDAQLGRMIADRRALDGLAARPA